MLAVARHLGLDPSAILDLPVSLNPFAPDVARLVAPHLDSGALARYPDDSAARDALAGAMGIDPDCVVLTNGGSEAIALVAGVLSHGWAGEPEFSLYRRHLLALGPSGLDPSGPVFRSNPHNPTGLLAQPDESADVWDEAFFPLATGLWTRGDAASRGAVVIGSLTKLFACPGLRIGYVVAPDARLASVISERKPQWSVNSLAVEVLPELLDMADLPGWARAVRRARRELAGLLDAHGLSPRRSDANWVLAGNAHGLRERLAPRGVLVRDCAGFGLPGVARVAVTDAAGMERLSAALRATEGAPEHDEQAGSDG